MKMPAPLYQELKADIVDALTHPSAGGASDDLSIAAMWRVFHVVMRNRMYSDDHPGFADSHWVRILAPWSRNGESPEMQGNDHWLNRFYVEHDLNDDHLRTALKRIAREISA